MITATTDSARRGAVVPAFETITNSRVTVGLGSRRLYIGVQSSRYRRSADPQRAVPGGYESSALWRAMGYLGCASLAFGLVFVAGGALRASPPVNPYAVVMPIDGKAAVAAPRHQAKPHRLVRTRPVAPQPAPVVDAADWSVAPAFDMGDGIATAAPDSDVATLPTTNGERAVAVYGPARRVGGKSCRDVSVFVRGTDGKVSVSPDVRCDAAR